MADLADRLREYIAACFTGLWVQSWEHEDALAEIARLCREQKWSLATWDIDRGLRLPSATADGAPGAPGQPTTDPLAAIKALSALAAPDKPEHSALLVLPNFHRFLQSAEIVQALAHQIASGKSNRTFVVVLSPVVQVPLELEKHFVVIEHGLPGRGQLAQIARGVATEAGELPEGHDLDTVLDAAAGLTRMEAEGAFALSLVRHRQVQPGAIWEMKTQALKKSGLLSLHRGAESFRGLGGLEALKAFCTRALTNHRPDASVRPRGVMLLSPPGCGKSQFCKALGNEMGRPTLILDVGSLMGSLVGESEQRTRQALRIADAMAPCVLMVDEVERALSGVASSGQTDSGVSARMFGTLLTWLNDHESDVFVVMTCNQIGQLPPEFTRAERFDGVFFVDLPTAPQRQAIWKIYLDRFGLDPEQTIPGAGAGDENWTGAEIRACCRLAKLLEVPLVEAAQNVVPVAVTAADAVEKLRGWAEGRCLSADNPGVYRRGRTSGGGGKVARRVTRPGDN